MHRDLTLHVKGSACKCTGKVAKIRGKKAKIGLESNFQDPTTQITSRQGSSSLVSLDVPSVL